LSSKIIVTGGAGFIGHAFAEVCFDLGFKVVVIDNLTYAGDKIRLSSIINKIEFYEADISSYEDLSKIFEDVKPDIVAHFAAESHVDRSIENASPFLKTNVVGTYNLLDLSNKYGVDKFINISTDEVYGDLGSSGEFFEDTNFNPSSPYSVSKASADMLGQAYFRTFGTPVITVRPSNNYGLFQFPEKLIPVVIIRAIKNLPIPVYGDGLNVREWLYVYDCSEGIIEIISNGKPGEIYNIGSGIEKTNIDVVTGILDILEKSKDLINFVDDRLGHDFRYRLNSDKLSKEIGFVAKTTFDEGIKQTVDWYVSNEDWWEKRINF